jgi:hypothetical protein
LDPDGPFFADIDPPLVLEDLCMMRAHDVIAGGLIVLLQALPSSLVAQTAVDIPLRVGFPPVIEGPWFTTQDALAVQAGGTIHVWRDLPHAFLASDLTPTGSDAMGGTWHRLAPTRAAYRSVGGDGTPRTADDPFVIVNGLPSQPVLSPTPLVGVDPEDFVAINNGIAVRTTPQGFHVLRHDQPAPVVDFIPSPVVLSLDPAFAPVRLDATLVAVSQGADGLVGTSDDELVVLSGLQTGSGLSVSVIPLPAGSNPRGMTATGGGVVVLWEDHGLPTVGIVCIHGLPGAATVARLDVTPPANPTGGITPGFWVEACPGEGIAVACTDDVGPGTAWALVRGVSTQPQIVGTWYDDGNGGCASQILSDTEVMTFCGAGGMSYTYDDYGSAINYTFNQAWDEVFFRKPAPGALVAFSQSTNSGSLLAQATVFSDAHNPAGAVTLSRNGRWAGDGYAGDGRHWAARAEPLGLGRMAGFVASSVASAPEFLRILSVPSIGVVGEGVVGAPSQVSLRLTAGMASGPNAVLEITADPSWSQALVAVTLGALPEPMELGPPIFAPGTRVYADLQSLVFLQSVSLTQGVGYVVADITAVTGFLTGRPLYAQALVHDPAGTHHASPALVTVLR